MNSLFFIFVSIFIFLYGGLNYYVGSRIHKTLIHIFPLFHGRIYWIFFWIIALSYIMTRLISKFLPENLLSILMKIGSYWLGAMFYLVIIFVCIDILMIIDNYMGFLPKNIKERPWIGVGAIIFVAIMLIYGTWNAKNPTVRHYDINISKQAGDLKDLHLVMVSDIHLGNIIHNGVLIKMVDRINDLHPDIILFAGDIIDENIEPFIEQKMGDTFGRLKSKYGSYAVLGNHEFIGRHENEFVDEMKNAGVHVLRDEYIKIQEKFYVAGRNDIVMKQFTKEDRKEISEILKGVDTSLPIILLDHNPKYIEESYKEGVDLQLSGHTHRGQFFPNNLITKKIFEVDWGYLAKEKFHVIVSSGFGTWGPPIRMRNGSEIVDIKIHFNKE